MPLAVIGAGVGRTGTYSLKLALNRLGMGPCHHMEEVLKSPAAQVPGWVDALQGKPDWEKIFAGYASTVDWPTAGFVGELSAAYPAAKFVLTLRSAESWAASFSETIQQVLADSSQFPPEMHDWHAMASGVIARTGFPPGLDRDQLMHAFDTHNERVKATIPAEKLLVFEAREGWEPLCAFLGVPVPDEPFPRSNDRAEFWDRVAGKA